MTEEDIIEAIEDFRDGVAKDYADTNSELLLTYIEELDDLIKELAA